MRRPALATALALATSLMLAAPAAASTPRHVGGGSVIGNKHATKAETRKLVRMAVVPADATVLSPPYPDLVSGPDMRPLTDSWVDSHRVWHVDSSFWDTYHWLGAHPPRQLSGGCGGGYTKYGHTIVIKSCHYYPAADRSYGVEFELALEVARGDHHDSYIRADGSGLWLDPTPARDSYPGPRLRVTVDQGCPGNDTVHHRVAVGVRNPGDPQLERRLIPAGRPTSALICTFKGYEDHPRFGLRQSARLGAAAAERLAHRARAIRLAHTDGDVTSCPQTLGRASVIVFAFPGHPDVDLLDIGGCGGVSNGHITTWGYVSTLPWAR